MLAKHYRPAPYDGGPSWATFLRHTRDSLSSIPLFRRESVLPRIHSILLAIGQFTRTIIGCGISGRNFDQTVVCPLFDTAIPVINASRSLRSIHDQPFSHHRCRKKLLGVSRTRTACPGPANVCARRSSPIPRNLLSLLYPSKPDSYRTRFRLKDTIRAIVSKC